MRRRRNQTQVGRRRGFTLLELLLVLSILLVVAGATTPAVVSLIGDYRLNQATEQVRIALLTTRVHAVERSSTYQFRFEPGGRRYLAIPTDQDGRITTDPNAAGGRTPDQSASVERSAAIAYGQLSESCTFQAVADATGGVPLPNAAGSVDPEWVAALAALENAADLASVAWSPPILFHADGTASDAAMDVVDTGQHGFRLTVRELTGEVASERVAVGAR